MIYSPQTMGLSRKSLISSPLTFQGMIEYTLGLLKGYLLGYSRHRVMVTSFRVAGHRIRLPFLAFKSQFRHIFLFGEYAFASQTAVPRILDLGGNFGVSCLYFKEVYPQAKITAFEADPSIARILKDNIAAAGYERDVECRNQAVWLSNGTLEFTPDGLDGGTFELNTNRDQPSVSVPTVDLKQYLQENGPYDLVKMDVEGAEIDLIPHAIEELAKTPLIVFEYHSIKSRPQQLGHILALFELHNFRCYLDTEDPLKRPFVNQLQGIFDNRIVIYCVKNQ